MYADVFKRVIDFCLSLLALIVLSPFFLILVLAGTIAMRGNPFFVQPRPGRKGTDGKEIIFYLIKFRTMDNKTDAQGRMLPDEKRLNVYGRFLRTTSADELPSLVNILIGDMAIVGPRPQLVRDMVPPGATELTAVSKYCLCYEKTAYLRGFNYWESDFENRGDI